MLIENLNVNGVMIPHVIVSAMGDGACLFRALSYVMYGSQVLHTEVREQIVDHVVENWEEFCIMSHDRDGNNYSSEEAYFIDMSRPYTYGGLCELTAAGQLFNIVFEVYRNGELYAKFGNEIYPVERLRFTSNLSCGHFDAYLPYRGLDATSYNNASPSQSSVETDLTINTLSTPKSFRKYRARYTDATRKSQLKAAARNYSQRNPGVNRSAVAAYQKKNPDLNKAGVKKYQEKNPEVHRASAKKYQEENPEVYRLASQRYQQENPEIHREAVARYERNNPGVRAENRMALWRIKTYSGLTYNPNISYENDNTVAIGSMCHKCAYCSALKWKDETPGMCCCGGKVQIPPLEPLPEPLYSLIMDSHPEHAHFMDCIRKYNGCFQMTSFGARQISERGFMPTFKVQGQVYHLLGGLLPISNQVPQFLQIYFVGEDDREARLRCSNFPNVKQCLVKQLQRMLHEKNKYIRDLKIAMEKVPPGCEFKIAIHADRKPVDVHAGRFNTPTSNEVALVMVGQIFERRDIILQSHDNTLQRISEIHRSYDALQYPLLYCHGEDGYSVNIPQRDPITRIPLKKMVSAASFYSYRLMLRENEMNHLLYFRSLLSQYLVDMYAKIESERLNFIRNNQAQLRVESYIHLRDAVGRQDSDANQLGQVVVLPSSFTGGPRYMHEKTQDAMTYVRHYGRPDLFITFTCNPRWKEIIDTLLPGQKSHDRHDIIARVFHLKVKKMVALLTKGKLFGSVRCFMYSVEWQKRGLPHVHILLWLEQRISPDKIDDLISAEVPNPNTDPILYDIIKSNMIHGPCGHVNRNSPCMKEGKCGKKYPRPLLKDTQTGDDGYPKYRRRSSSDGGFVVDINGIQLDSRWVVPYNPVLSRTFNAHINVEYCNSVKAIKYICKYVNKGTDQASFVLENDKDEVKSFESGRYISSSEAMWRIFGFSIHERYPTVFHLAVHLENGQRVYFNSNNLIDRVNNPPKTTLLSFFELCETDNFAKTLLYSEVPSYFVWKINKFLRRKQGLDVEGWPGVKKDNALGRVYTIHPNNTECYHLRLLLHKVRGPTSFSDLKTVDGVLYPTFQSACQALGLLEDDKSWDTTLEEAALCDSPHKLRDLFSIMLVFCQLSNPLALWEKYKNFLAEDITQQITRDLDDNTQQNIMMDIVHNKCLLIIEEVVLSLGGYRLSHYSLPQPSQSQRDLNNQEYTRETSYDIISLAQEVSINETYLTDEQLTVYNQVYTSIVTGSGQTFFLDAPGGTGKTFLINLLLAKVRSDGGIALAVASSGIAATLLKGGKTAHAAFKLPLNLIHVESPQCNISKQSNMAKVLKDCKLIVWDESTMAHKGGFEALSRTLKDIRGNDGVMGGITVLLAGDFRQTLPVVPRGTRADEVKSCIKSSYLWALIEKMSLKKNMRVHVRGDLFAGQFSELILKIGNGEFPIPEGKISIPSGLGTIVNTLEELTSKIYPEIEKLIEKSADWLCERAILTPKNNMVTSINKFLIDSFEGVHKEYMSLDSVIQSEQAVHYPVEFLNTLNPPGLPEHRLFLKVGAPVLLLRNLNPPKLCNGTRLRLKALHRNMIEATILTGSGKGESVFIPRIPLIPSEYPFDFKRLQFPLKLCFAMTINKSQGQTFKEAGIDLREDCFSHGQFYVACSRVSSPNSLVILAPEGKTSNVVYKEVLK